MNSIEKAPADKIVAVKYIQWIGGPTTLLQLGSFKILIDPILGPKSKVAFRIKKHPITGELNAPVERYTNPAAFDKKNIDILLISHPHPDHIDDKAVELLDKNLLTVTTTVSVAKMVEYGFANTEGLEWQDEIILQKESESLRIVAMKAMHAKEGSLNSELGKVNGYIIEYTNPAELYRIYCTGDTVWFEDIKKYQKIGTINLLIPNLGAVGLGERGLNAEQCMKIVKALNPQQIIPVHHSTFSHYTEPITVFEEQIAKTIYRDRLKVIDLGTIVQL